MKKVYKAPNLIKMKSINKMTQTNTGGATSDNPGHSAQMTS